MSYPALEELLPLATPMLWLDAVQAWDADARALTCSLTLRADQPFVQGERAPALYALEWMAQAAQVLRALAGKDPCGVRNPFLLARIERAQFQVESFALGSVLAVSAHELADGAFECSVVEAHRSAREQSLLGAERQCTARLSLRERLPAAVPGERSQ